MCPVARFSTSSPASTGVVAAANGDSATAHRRTQSFVLSTAGPDRAGIVRDMTKLLFDLGANLEESRMTILGNDFAMIVRVTAPEEVSAQSLQAAVSQAFPSFLVSCRSTGSHPGFDGPVRIFSVSVEGPDQPGVAKTLSDIFYNHKGSIRDLDTDSTNAPFAGYKIFSLKTVVAMPVTADFESFERALHKFEDEFGFDVDVHEGMESAAEGEEGEDNEEDWMNEEDEEMDEPEPPRRGPPSPAASAAAAQNAAAARRAPPPPPPQRATQQQQPQMRGPPQPPPSRGQPQQRGPPPPPGRGPSRK